MLFYSEGRYVQLLEGPAGAVQDVYARIQRDPRHEQVVTVSEGLGPRRFADWRMDFGYVTAAELERALIAIQVPAADPPASVTDPRLQALVQAFL